MGIAMLRSDLNTLYFGRTCWHDFLDSMPVGQRAGRDAEEGTGGGGAKKTEADRNRTAEAQTSRDRMEETGGGRTREAGGQPPGKGRALGRSMGIELE
jgi:hypothetical protein